MTLRYERKRIMLEETEITTVGKQHSRYEPTGKRSPGRPSWLDKRAERRAEEARMAGKDSPTLLKRELFYLVTTTSCSGLKSNRR